MHKLLTATALAAALAPAGAFAQDDGYTFALVPKAMNNPFFDLARDGCYAAQEELPDVTCRYIGPGEHTELEQIQIIQDLISQGVDGIAVAPSNAPAMARALRAAEQAGIPVMTWDSDLLEQDMGMRTTYVGTKNYDIGVELANIVKAQQPDGGTVCLQTGGAAAANHNERLKGIRDTLAGEDTGPPPGEPARRPGRLDRDRGLPADHRRRRQQGGAGDDGHPRRQSGPHGLRLHRRLHPVVRQRLSPGHPALRRGDGERRAHRRGGRHAADADGAAQGRPVERPGRPAPLRDGLPGDVHPQGHRRRCNEVDDPIYTGLDVCTEENADSCLAG